MFKRKDIFLSALLCALMINNVSAQDKSLKEIKETSAKKFNDDTTHISGWRKGGLYSLGIGQGGSRNWAAGAEKFSFSIAANTGLFANYKAGRFSMRNTLDLGYSLVNTTSQGVRKTDDKIDLYTKSGYDLTKKTSVAIVANFRTQFASGYDYDYLGEGLQRRTSGFMAPGYLILAPGIDYHPSDFLSVFVSPVSGRFVFVTNDPKSYYYENGLIPGGPGYETPLAVLYGVDPARKVRAELGGFASVNFSKEIIKNVAYKSRLDLYSNYLSTTDFEVIGPDQLAITKQGSSPEKIDIFWTNLFVMKVNKYLNVSFAADIIYDDDVKQFGTNNNSAAMQFRSQLTVGLAGTF